MMIYLQLFFEFFKAGLFAVGGGMATLPFLYDISDKTGWFTYGQLADMVAISESTPGPIGVKMCIRDSRATCTMSIKEFWRSSAVVASPVIRESEMVRMESAWAPASAALA